MEVRKSFPMYPACNLNYLGKSIFLVSVAGQLPNIIMYHNIIKITVSYEMKVQMRIRRTTSLPMKLNRDEPRASSSPSQRQRCQKPRAASANFYPIIFYPKTKEILPIHLFSINPSQKRWREEKKSKSFLFTPDYLQFEDKGMFYQFSQKYTYPSFRCFSRLPPTSQRKFYQFPRGASKQIFLSEFSFTIRLPSLQKPKNANHFLGASEKPMSKQQFTFSLFISLPVIISNGDYGQADSRANHKM